MTAYFVLELEITNRDALKFYLEAATNILSQYGGRFLARGGPTELIEGVPELEAHHRHRGIRRQGGVQAFLLLTRYHRILPDRLANCNGRAFVVEGAA